MSTHIISVGRLLQLGLVAGQLLLELCLQHLLLGQPEGVELTCCTAAGALHLLVVHVEQVELVLPLLELGLVLEEDQCQPAPTTFCSS